MTTEERRKHIADVALKALSATSTRSELVTLLADVLAQAWYADGYDPEELTAAAIKDVQQRHASAQRHRMDKKSLKKSLAILEQLRKDGELDDAIGKVLELAQERGVPVPAAPLPPEQIKSFIETMKDADDVPEAVQRIIQAQKGA